MLGSAGAGKSTLAKRLSQLLPDCDLVGEEAIFERAEFTEAGTSFANGECPESHLLAGYGRLASRNQSVVMDWNPASMAENLVWARRQEVLDAHVVRVAAHFEHYALTLLHLVAPIEVTTRRAWLERGDPWLDHYAQMSTSTAATTLDRAVDWHARQRAGLERCLRAYASASWPVETVDATGPPDDVLLQAKRTVGLAHGR